MGFVIGEALAVDFLSAFDDSGTALATTRKAVFALRARQIAGGEGFTIRDDAGRLALMGGLYPTAPDEAEAWMAIGPALKADTVKLMACARELFAAIGRDVAPLDVAAYSRAGSVAAPTLARWFGFRPEPELVASVIGPLQHWTRRF